MISPCSHQKLNIMMALDVSPSATLIMYQQHSGLMLSIKEWSAYRYVWILFFIVLCDDAYGIVVIFRDLYF